ncbi:MAG: 16S rRNA (cytosine(967)-C(5))-methyltransferase RsmB [Magnetococcales bacterium]|nr:16S rRNA (cytosine(967)-C(5))-methyltransferase RsmB [Magnetococcales bacterium]
MKSTLTPPRATNPRRLAVQAGTRDKPVPTHERPDLPAVAAPPPRATNPRRLAAEAVTRVTRDGLALSLDDSRLAGLDPRDRGLALEIAAGTLRHLNLLDAILDSCMPRPLAKGRHFLRAVLRTALYQARFLRVPARAAIHEAVELVKDSPDRPKAGFVNALLRTATNVEPATILDRQTDPVDRLALEHAHPPWLTRRWWHSLGEEATRARLLANNTPPPLVLRVNRLKSDRNALLAALGTRGAPHPFAPDGMIVTPSGPVEALPGYREGWFAVQDAAAQWPARLLGPQPGEEILDLCAAPGGKTAQLADLTGNQARIHAVDNSPSRLKTLTENLTRLGIQQVTITAGDATQPDLLAGETFDKILADLPCTGTGVIRRHPEIKWRRQEEDPRRMAAIQQTILENCAHRLRPGGLLVYAVCSLEPEEGAERIREFLSTHPHWHRLPITPLEHPALPPAAITPDGDLRFEPARDVMDGFFIARLKRD